MFFKRFFNLALIIACATSMYSINAATIIDTPNGQFSVPGGQTACTAIAITAAAQLLTTPTADWTPERLNALIDTGVTNYKTIVKQNNLPHDHFFNTLELTAHFPQVQHIRVINIAPAMPNDYDFANFFAAQEQVITTEDLPEVMLASNAQGPVAGIWTTNNASQLICYQSNQWLFLDSHTQSDGTSGASAYLFDSSFEFRIFLAQHRVFKLTHDQQANLTLLKQTTFNQKPTSLNFNLEKLFPDSAGIAQQPITEIDDLYTEFTLPMADLPTPAAEKRPGSALDDQPARKKRTLFQNRPFKCPHLNCTYTSTNYGNIRSHIYTHASKKCFKCPNCDFATKINAHLNRHMRIHTGEKPYRCAFTDCGYAAACSNHLTEHMRTHTGKKPFTCDYLGCNFATAHQGDLTRHKFTHTGKKPFTCDYPGCNFTTVRRIYLTKHKHMHHPEDEPQ